MNTKITALILCLSGLLVRAVCGFSSDGSSLARSFDKAAALTNAPIVVTVNFTNRGAAAARGFWYGDQVPSGLAVMTLSVMLDGRSVTSYTFEGGQDGDVCAGCTPYRWILERPTSFSESNAIPTQASAQIVYSISSAVPGTFSLQQFSWAGYDRVGTNAAFGYSEDVDGMLVSFSGTPVLTISAQSTNKVYGAPLPEFTPLYSGFVNGDTPANLSSPPVLTTTATDASPAGSYPIHVSGAVSTNYTIQYVEGTLSILPAGTTGLVSSSANPALPGNPVTFTLMLSAVAPGAGIPTGTAQFKIDGVDAGGPDSLSGGSASYTTSALAHGLHSVAVEYAGDGNFTGTTNWLVPDQLINTPPVTGPAVIERDPSNSVKVAIAALLSNDLDPDGDTLTFVGVSGTSANGATLTNNGGWIFYTPAPGFTNSDTFTYTISDGWGAPVTGTVTVNIRVDNGPSPNLTIISLGGGSYAIRGDGIPGRTYRIQFAEDLANPNWQVLGSATTDGAGVFTLLDTSGASLRLYRSVYP